MQIKIFTALKYNPWPVSDTFSVKIVLLPICWYIIKYVQYIFFSHAFR